MLNQKAEIPLIKTIVILLITTVILITYLIMLFEMPGITIDEKKLDTQITINNILNKNCFSDDFATIEKSKFNSQYLDNCLGKNNENLLLKLILNGKVVYLDNKKKDFEDKRKLCSIPNSNLLCTEMKYPITYINNNKDYDTKILTLQIITT